MWFEVLPSAVIITVAMSLPGYLIYGLHSLCLGNPYRRNMDERFDRCLYLRDRRLNNNPYIQNGLENITDEKDEKNGNNENSGNNESNGNNESDGNNAKEENST